VRAAQRMISQPLLFVDASMREQKLYFEFSLAKNFDLDFILV